MHLLLALVATPIASGAGFFLTDSGVIANGRAGAWVASADSRYAQYYNPAGLARIEVPEVDLGATLNQQYVDFTRMDEVGDEWVAHDPVRNEAPMLPIPEVGFAAPLREGLVLAVGFYSPSTWDNLYPADGSQRYTMIDSLIWQGWAGPSVAWRPIDQVSIGAGLSWNFFRVEQHLAVTTSGIDNPSGDVAVDARVMDLNNLAFNLGLLVEPVEWLSIGASYVPPSSFDAGGNGDLDFGDHALWTAGLLDQQVWSDDDIALRMRLPYMARFGVAARPVPILEVELAWVYEGWSGVGNIRIEEVDVTVTGGDLIEEEVQSTFTLPSAFGDAWSLRLGAEVEPIDQLAIRAGAFYETSVLEDNALVVNMMDVDKVGISVGLTGKLLDERLLLDGAFGWRPPVSKQIRDSTITQINAYGGEELVVGNGDYKTSSLSAGAAVRWRFGRP